MIVIITKVSFGLRKAILINYIQMEKKLKINELYTDDPYINDFYNKVRLGSELHRLDYLLMNIIGLQKQCQENTELYSRLGKIKDTIIEKRNIM